jgi:uncharacterized membrane protein YphA (DoxX/SURF4 family)
MSKFTSFMFGASPNIGKYAFVALRLVVAAFWLNSDIPPWIALASGHPQANGLVRNLFGPNMVIPLTYVFTALETLGAIALILGFATRSAALWGVIKFTMTGTFTGLLASPYSNGQAKDYALMVASLALLLNGSPKLSLDSLISKRMRSKPLPV